MNFTYILLLLILIPTLIIILLRKLLKNSNSKFAEIINKLWYEWFEDQYNAIESTFILIIILIILFIILIPLFK